MYNVGTVTTTANSTKLVGVGTKWKDNNSRVSAEQVILIQNGATICINSIASIQSNTEITLSFPVPASVSNAPYQILTTMVNSVSDAANKVVAMNVANVQFSDILNRWATESGTITVTLPDGTTQQLRTAKEMDKLLDGKFDKTGGVIVADDITLTAKSKSDGTATRIAFERKDGTRRGFVGAPGSGDYIALANSATGKSLSLNADGSLTYADKKLMHVGDFGVGEPIVLTASDNLGKTTEMGIYMQPYTGQATIAKEYPIERAGTLIVTPTAGGNVLQEYRSHNSPALIYYRSINGAGTSVNTPWISQYNTGNTTKDANGNLKAASPIVKVFADHIETNEESEGVEMEHLGVGHYLIKGVVGFNADGAWGINNGFVIPQDHNGKNMVLIDYDVKPDGDIDVFVFHQQNADLPERFQNKRIKYIDKDGNPVYYENYEPCDVPESRWIDMRVEMPVNSIYNLKKAEAERLAKEEAERQAEEEAKNAEIEAEEDI